MKKNKVLIVYVPVIEQQLVSQRKLRTQLSYIFSFTMLFLTISSGFNYNSIKISMD